MGPDWANPKAGCWESWEAGPGVQPVPGQSGAQAEFREPDWLYESQLGSQQEARIKIEDMTNW